MNIIGIHGHKGVGKDTAARFLIERHGFIRMAFADRVKEAASALFPEVDVAHWDVIKNDPEAMLVFQRSGIVGIELTARHFLQRIGTEMGRNLFGEDFWIDQLRYRLEMMMTECAMSDKIMPGVVIPDVRFRNEALFVHNNGGAVIRITRPGHEPDGHRSEEVLDHILIDTTVRNSNGIEDFKRAFLATYEALMKGIVNGH